MPAVLLQTAAAAVQRFNQIQAFDAAAASFANTLFLEPDHNRRPMIFARNSRGNNSQYPRMPAARVNDDRRIAPRIELPGNLLVRGEVNFLFDFLSLAVLFVKQFSERRPLGFVLC